MVERVEQAKPEQQERIPDFEQTTIEIASWGEKMIEVDAWVSPSRPHLAISDTAGLNDDRLVITHTPTGCAVFFGNDNLEAMKLLFERIYDLVDWTLPMDDIAPTLEKNMGVTPHWQFRALFDEIKGSLALKQGQVKVSKKS